MEQKFLLLIRNKNAEIVKNDMNFITKEIKKSKKFLKFVKFVKDAEKPTKENSPGLPLANLANLLTQNKIYDLQAA